MRAILSDLFAAAIIIAATLAFTFGLWAVVQSATPGHVYAQYAGGE